MEPYHSRELPELPLLEEVGEELTIAEGLGLLWHLHFKGTRGAKPQRSNIRVLIRSLGNIKLDRTTGPDVARHRRDRINGVFSRKQCAPQTANKDQMLLSLMFNCLLRWKMTGTFAGRDFSKLKLPVINPCRFVKKADWKQFSRKRIVTDDEEALFLEHATDRIKNIFVMARQTALRKKDLVDLRKTDMDRKTRTIRVVQSKTRKEKEIYVSNQMLQIFQEAKNLCVLDFTNYRREWGDALKRSRVQRFTLGDIRKTSVTQIYRATNDLKLAQETAGHQDPAVTWTYIVIPNRQIKKIGNILSRRKKLLYQRNVPARKAA